MKTRYLILALAFTACQKCEQTVPTSQRQLFVMLGDSQMVGQGNLEPETQDKHVLMYSFNNQWTQAQEPTHDATQCPYQAYVGMHGQFSCGLHFGKVIRAIQPSIEVGIIPCGRNGALTQEWLPTTDFRGYGETLFDDCSDRLDKAKLSSQGQLAGVIIHLGSNDAYRTHPIAHDPTQWHTIFKQLVSAIQMRWGNVPIVFARLGLNADPNALDWQTVKDRQAAIDIPGVRTVNTETLELGPDGLHLSTQGERTLGEYYAQTIISSDACQDPWYLKLFH